jgi:hypothetical protein
MYEVSLEYLLSIVMSFDLGNFIFALVTLSTGDDFLGTERFWFEFSRRKHIPVITIIDLI